MNRAAARRLLSAAGPPVLAAVLGNVFIGKAAMRWFAGLRHPSMQLPLRGFVAVGAVYYILLGVVLHRAHVRDDRVMRNLAYAVLGGNELWNAVFFGRRSARAGHFGLLIFVVPVLALQARANTDQQAKRAMTPYTAWVLLYDVPWTYLLWRLNRDTSRASPGPAL
jgi:translocator protein